MSSRPYAVEQNWLKDIGFEDAELLPMELADVTSFIEHWHCAVRDELQGDAEREEVVELSSNLKEIVKKSIQLRKLATNPLLCAMLCALHRDRQRKLPSDRIELYDACLRMLIERRDVERGVDLSDYPEIGYRQKRALLQDFAYWLIKNGYSMVPLPQAEKRFEQKLKVLENVAKGVTGQGVRRLLIERSGILREPVKGEVDFTHRTFQEFLSGQAALDDRDLGLLVRNAHLQEWREVVVLAAGLARPIEREEIIRRLIERGDKEAGFRHQLHLLAVACLETSIELSADLKREVSKRLQKLIPPTNLTEAKALASAGELALSFLAKRYRTAGVTAACIRTLSLIGGDASLSILEDYYPDDRVAVVSEFTKAWDYFDRRDYAARIFGKSPHLELTRPSSLDGLDVLRRLEYLTIFEAGKVKDFGPIGSLESLGNLWCSQLYGANGFPTLRGLSNLTSLYLWGSASIDIEFLIGLTSLLEVSVGNFENLSDLNPLSSLMSLRGVKLVFLPKVTDISPITRASDLRSLQLISMDTLNDITPISKLDKLETLDLDGSLRINDLSVLANCTELTNVNLTRLVRLIDLSPLSHLTRLVSLVLRSCTAIEDLKPLSSLTNLTHVDLGYCRKVYNLAPLTSLPNLRWINIRGTPAAELEIPTDLLRRDKPKLTIMS